MENAEVARILSETADLLELSNANAFKVRAYRQAAQVVETLPRHLRELWSSGELRDVAGIGERIFLHIGELLQQGDFAEHEKLASQLPAGLLEIMRIEGIGPKTAAGVWHELQIADVEALESACRNGSILSVPRMGALRVKAILQAIARYRARQGRTPLYKALAFAESMLEQLRRLPGVERAEAAGSLRRRVETVGDLDLLVAARDAEPVMRAVPHLKGVTSPMAEGPSKTAVRLASGMQVDVRVVPPQSYGAALYYFTGSKTHNIAVRTRAVRMGLKINEYGVFDRKDRMIAGATEEEIFRVVGLPFIAPELRENSGEIEAAEAGKLPRLLEEKDLLGDLHVHSDASSDGKSSVDELVAAARELGRHYLAITDHSRSRPLGLDNEHLKALAKRIRQADRRLAGRPHLLAGIEVDILADGQLDLAHSVLADLDWVVASIHSRFQDSAEQMTSRMVNAIFSEVVDVIGHPSGRQLGARDPYAFDLEQVLDAAREAGVAMEVNATPERMDLPDRACRRAKEKGVKLVISSDAHHESQLANLKYGVWVARRGWLERGDVANTEDWETLRGRRKRVF